MILTREDMATGEGKEKKENNTGLWGRLSESPTECKGTVVSGQVSDLTQGFPIYEIHLTLFMR